MKVARWMCMKQATADGLTESLGGWGGWFNGTSGNKNQHWQDYLVAISPESRQYADALREELLRTKIRRGGFWHQYDPEGTPLIDDGTCALFSLRAWGDLLAAV